MMISNVVGGIFYCFRLIFVSRLLLFPQQHAVPQQHVVSAPPLSSAKPCEAVRRTAKPDRTTTKVQKLLEEGLSI